MKKKICALMVAAILCTTMLASCGSSNNASGSQTEVPSESSSSESGAPTGNETVGDQLTNAFFKEVESNPDLEALASTLESNPALEDQGMAHMAVEPGYLNGFEEEITGFTSGVVFSPMIGSIPFVGYVFLSDDPDGLRAELESKAMLNWNICTVADEMHSAVSGNYVFFVMSPYSFEQ